MKNPNPHRREIISIKPLGYSAPPEEAWRDVQATIDGLRLLQESFDAEEWPDDPLRVFWDWNVTLDAFSVWLRGVDKGQIADELDRRSATAGSKMEAWKKDRYSDGRKIPASNAIGRLTGLLISALALTKAARAAPPAKVSGQTPNKEEWLIPMSLANMANRLLIASPKKAKIILRPYQLKHAGNVQLWTVRLDDMPLNMRQKLERV